MATSLSSRHECDDRRGQGEVQLLGHRARQAARLLSLHDAPL